jgi:hypothetical protein
MVIAMFLLILTIGSTARAQTFGPGWEANTDAFDGYTRVQCSPGAWAASTVEATGAVIKDSNGNIEKATTGGTTGTSAPTWGTALGTIITDNIATWTRYDWWTQKIGNRWWICDPAGNGFIMKGLTTVLYNSNNEFCTGNFCDGGGSINFAGYVNNPTTTATDNFYLEIARRMQQWDFNVIADESAGNINPSSFDNAWEQIPGNSGNPYIPIKIPFVFSNQHTTQHGLAGTCNPNPSTGWAMKDETSSTGAAYQTYPYDVADYMDPQWPTCLSNYIANTSEIGTQLSAANINYLLYLNMDESDETGMLDSGTDFATYPAGHNALHGAWVTLAASPSICASASVLNVGAMAYNECVNHTKLAMANYLLNEYLSVAQNTYSVDPAAGNYVGSSRMATATAALNAAWGSSFSTLGTSDSHCTTNLAVCLGSGGSASVTYTSWAPANCKAANTPVPTICTGVGTGTGTKGTGLLDEDGSDAFMGDPCSLVIYTANPQSCQDNSSSSETTAMQADLNNWLYVMTQNYYVTENTAWHTAGAGPGVMLEMNVGSWSVPPRPAVLQATGQYVEFPNISGPSPEEWDPTTEQQIVDYISHYMGDHPYTLFTGTGANSDSSQAATVDSAQIYATQALRGAGYQTMVTGVLGAISPTYTDDYQIMGWYHYAEHDVDAQGYNWGVDSNFENPYDGKQAGMSGTFIDQYGIRAVSEELWPFNCQKGPDDADHDSPYPYPGCLNAGVASWTGPKLPQNLACTASAAPYSWCTGLYTGTAQGNYGDSIDAVTSANLGVYQLIAPITVARPGGIF